MPKSDEADDGSITRLGVMYGIGAFGMWGVFPLYFKVLTHVPPLQVLAHRVIWSAVLLAVVVTGMRRWNETLRALGTRRAWICLGLSTLLIAVNWYVFIVAVSSNRVIETSLGYYMTPLANVVLGCLFLRERLRPLQLAAIALSGVGVAMLANGAPEFPWIAISLAISFSLYGLLRKVVGVDSLYGLLFETTALCPAALALITWQYVAPAGQLALPSAQTLGLLALAGPITSGPLLLFAAAARRLRMATLGILQFLAPTLQFLIAVLVFGEQFTPVHAWSFTCIWLAIAIYSGDALWGARTRAAAAPAMVADRVSAAGADGDPLPCEAKSCA